MEQKEAYLVWKQTVPCNPASLNLKNVEITGRTWLAEEDQRKWQISSNRLVIKLVDNYVAKEFRFN